MAMLSLRASGCGLIVKVSITPTGTPPPPPAATPASTSDPPVSRTAHINNGLSENGQQQLYFLMSQIALQHGFFSHFRWLGEHPVYHCLSLHLLQEPFQMLTTIQSQELLCWLFLALLCIFINFEMFMFKL